MKKLFTLTFIFFSFFAKADYWTQKADFGGGAKSAAVGFSLNGFGYVGTGYGTPPGSNDFWQYDPVLNSWTQKANVGNVLRSYAIGFTIGNYGYIGLGEGNGFIMNDLWQYDPVNNTWTQVPGSFPGLPRRRASAFVCNNKAYIGMGYTSTGTFENAFWSFDPVFYTWTPIASFPGAPRMGTIAFSINGRGYVGSGEDNNNFYHNYFKYHPVSNSWTQIASCPGTTNTNGIGFAIDSVGYACLGFNSYDSIVWMYSPSLNTWAQKANFPSFPRGETVAFTIGTHCYLATGIYQWGGFAVPTNEVWGYTSDSTTSIEELPASNFQFSISPNPAKDYLIINLEGFDPDNYREQDLTITDVEGKKVYETKLQTKTLNFKLQTLNLSKGIYFVELNNGKQKAVKKFVKE